MMTAPTALEKSAMAYAAARRRGLDADAAFGAAMERGDSMIESQTKDEGNGIMSNAFFDLSSAVASEVANR